jgi:5-methylcytosine-specific restriction endonuclease McrA
MGKKSKGAKNSRFISRGLNGEKRCSRCITYRPIEWFVVDRSRFDGRGYVCRPCRLDERVSPGPSIPIRRDKAQRGLAWCSVCREWKPKTSTHSGKCRPCSNAWMRQHYRNSESFRMARRQHAASRKRGLSPIPVDAQVMILEDFGGQCAYCNSKASSWDHVVPVSRGGLTEPYNIVPACFSCNSSKGSKNVWDWLRDTGRKPKEQLVDRLVLYEVRLYLPKGPDPF